MSPVWPPFNTVLACGCKKGCTMALVAAIAMVMAKDSSRESSLPTTDTKATATSFWTISMYKLRHLAMSTMYAV